MLRRSAFVFWLLAAVAGVHAGEKNTSGCVDGKLCTVVGLANIFPPAEGEQSWLELDSHHHCVALSLPDNVYAEHGRWNGKRVKVAGTAYRQPSGKFFYYEIKGRRISSNLCVENPLIVVDRIALVGNR